VIRGGMIPAVMLEATLVTCISRLEGPDWPSMGSLARRAPLPGSVSWADLCAPLPCPPVRRCTSTGRRRSGGSRCRPWRGGSSSHNSPPRPHPQAKPGTRCRRELLSCAAIHIRHIDSTQSEKYREGRGR
jgi:hypothetical protein